MKKNKLTNYAQACMALLSVSLLLLFSQPSLALTSTRASAFEYDPVSGLLTKEIIEPDDPNLCLVTTYLYDGSGNKTSATTRNCNGSAGSHPGTNSEAAAPPATVGATANPAIIETRTTTTNYDGNGRYPTTSSNALGQTETKIYNTGLGVVTKLTGPNNLDTSWTYDSYGRPLTEIRADGTSTTTGYALCDVNCPVNGKYVVTSTQAGMPSSKTVYDMKARAIQSASQDIAGTFVYTSSEYDKLGRNARTSRPYKVYASAKWTQMTYDVLNRPLTRVEPDGSTSTIAHSGLTMLDTNAKGQTKTTITNTQGQTAIITDVLGRKLYYQYDAFSNLTKTVDALSNATVMSFDKRGRKTAMDDPDQGVWSYQYDVLGQLKVQTDAKGQIVKFTYDKLGRMTQRVEPDLASTWTFDTCDVGLNPAGKCIGKVVKEVSDNGYSRTYAYDAFGRPTGEYNSNGNAAGSLALTKAYDSYGRVASLTYPPTQSTTFQINHTYSTSGHLAAVKNAATNAAYWTAVATTDDEGRITQTTYGNNITNTYGYNALTGRLATITAGTSNSVNNQSFVYDSIGNITQRYDQITGLNEGFGYDDLNRLTATTAQASNGGPLTQVTLTYNAIGNILTKSDIGTYAYNSLKANGQVRPHAVSQIMMNGGASVYGTYAYDANGNMTSGVGRTITWSSWNMVTGMTGTEVGKSTPVNTTSSIYSVAYNSAHERYKTTLPNGTIVYAISPRVDTGINIEKRIKTDGTIEFVNSLYAGKMPFGTVSLAYPGGTGALVTKTRYFHTDHIGSITAITDEAGVVTERRSYDAWGKRRNLNGTSTSNAFVTPDERHGFTGHEEWDELGLINMNGRLYDPAIGRFISADPTVQYADDMQNYNRYSYINNNPLSAVDYSGHGFLSAVFGAAIGFFTGGPAGALLGGAIFGGSDLLNNSFFRTVLSIAAAYYVPGLNLFGDAVLNTFAGGFVSGLISGRGDLEAAITGGITSVAFFTVGHKMGFPETGTSLGKIGAHAVVGCVSATMGGGKCGQGALSAGFTQALSPGIDGIQDRIARTAAAAVVGGTASVLSGGKFENGAMTGAFSRLFNDEAPKRMGEREGCNPLDPCLNSKGQSERNSIFFSAGGSIIPVYGAGGYAGFYFSTYPLDAGLLGSGEYGPGIDFGLSAKVGLQSGELTGISKNLNVSYVPVSVSMSFDSYGNVNSVSGGLALRAGGSYTTSETGTLSLRNWVRQKLGMD
jgi:RHS repeat-associated protein